MAFSWIELDGVLNMRDLAGTRLAGGDRIAPHRLVRSDNLNFLTCLLYTSPSPRD